MSLRTLIPVVVAAVLAITAPITAPCAQSFSPQPNLQMGNYNQLLNEYYAAGCLSGAVIGGALGYMILSGVPTGFFGFPAYLFSFTLNGCAVGLMAGPVGLAVRDQVTGDNAVERYMDENW